MHKNILNPLAVSSIFFAALCEASPSVYPTGVTRYNPSKAYNSYVLFAGQDKKTHLIDLNGNEVHQWNYNGFPSVFIDPKLVGGKKGHVLVQFTGETGGRSDPNGAQAIGETDWDGNIIWQWSGVKSQDAYASGTTTADATNIGSNVRQHHDWRKLPNGNTLILVNYQRPVTGFKAEKLLEDGIYELTPEGKVVWQWAAYDHFNEYGFSDEALKLIRESTSRNDKTVPFDYLHFNNMSVVGPNKWFDAGDARFNPDNIVVCAREANFTAIIDKKTGKIVWHIGPDYPPITTPNKLPRPVDQITGQHDAHIIPKGLPGEGNLLVFDNQGEAGYPSVKLNTQPGSRVLEIDPIKNAIVWQYTGVDSGAPNYTFYSSYISSARRLPNGNTLIDEGMNGRFFQVTAQGEIVWEYISPYFSKPNPKDEKPTINNSVFRAQPVPYDWAPDGTPRSEKPVKPLNVSQYQLPVEK
ncbi:MAG TPA: aryl-sulfate sulfotransferase [Cellvibrionaceae bacterium]